MIGVAGDYPKPEARKDAPRSGIHGFLCIFKVAPMKAKKQKTGELTRWSRCFDCDSQTVDPGKSIFSECSIWDVHQNECCSWRRFPFVEFVSVHRKPVLPVVFEMSSQSFRLLLCHALFVRSCRGWNCGLKQAWSVTLTSAFMIGVASMAAVFAVLFWLHELNNGDGDYPKPKARKDAPRSGSHSFLCIFKVAPMKAKKQKTGELTRWSRCSDCDSHTVDPGKSIFRNAAYEMFISMNAVLEGDFLL